MEWVWRSDKDSTRCRSPDFDPTTQISAGWLPTVIQAACGAIALLLGRDHLNGNGSSTTLICAGVRAVAATVVSAQQTQAIGCLSLIPDAHSEDLWGEAWCLGPDCHSAACHRPGLCYDSHLANVGLLEPTEGRRAHRPIRILRN